MSVSYLTTLLASMHVCIADLQSPPAKRLKPHPPSTPNPSDNPPTLPSEILHRVINHVDPEDKRTLGRCMRVSPTFNAIAAPRLYHTITIKEKSGLSDPYGKSTRGVFDIPVPKAWMKKTANKQKTQGKEKDLGFVRHIFFEGAIGLDSTPTFTKEADKKRFHAGVKSIQIAPEPGCSYYQYSQPIIDLFADIEKVGVVEGSRTRNSRLPVILLPKRCKKAVAIFPAGSCFDLLYEIGSRPRFNSTLKTLVFVFLPLTNNGHPGHSYVSLIYDAIVEAAIREVSHQKLLIVGQVVDIAFSPDNIQFTVRDVLVKSIEQHRQYLTSLKARNAGGADTAASPSSNVDPPRYPIVEFLTIREYLRDHDWAGEFQESQVRKMIEDEERFEALQASRTRHNAIVSI
jgi:hypothetical protein